jgi:N-acetylmuramoyl-L-alanine amidase
MKTVCIVVGHSALDGGAENTNVQISEYDYNRVFASQIAERLHRRNVRPVILYRANYDDLPNEVNRINPDYCIELHCNAVSNKTVKGQETLYWHASTKSKSIAKRIQAAIYGVLQERDRGIKPIRKGERGWRMLRDTDMPCIILEPFFISNDESLSRGLVMREQMANIVSNALVKQAQEDTNYELTR